MWCHIHPEGSVGLTSYYATIDHGNCAWSFDYFALYLWDRGLKPNTIADIKEMISLDPSALDLYPASYPDQSFSCECIRWQHRLLTHDVNQ